MSEGQVYVLSNPSMPGLLKIGFTRRTAEIRTRELGNATGVPTPFVIEASIRTRDAEGVEQAAHAILDRFRADGSREFFRIDVRTAVRAIEKASGRRMRRSDRKRRRPGRGRARIPDRLPRAGPREWFGTAAFCFLVAAFLDPLVGAGALAIFWFTLLVNASGVPRDFASVFSHVPIWVMGASTFACVLTVPRPISAPLAFFH